MSTTTRELVEPVATTHAPIDSLDAARHSAALFKALGDPVRLRLLSLISASASGEICVCDVTDEFNLSQPTISHHLKLLKDAGLITGERRGTWVFYRNVPTQLATAAAALKAVS